MSEDNNTLTAPVTLLGPEDARGERYAISERFQLCKRHLVEYQQAYPTTGQQKVFVIEHWTDKPCVQCDLQQEP